MAKAGDGVDHRHSPFGVRQRLQRKRFGLPAFPTTTIGSFPQTAKIRSVRAAFKRGAMNESDYTKAMQDEIAFCIAEQESLGLDVFVHGEPERNDMVEYFAGLLDGMAITFNGWVQSYGSRCVKPPVIYGDVSRPGAMTVEWTKFAQSLTDKPVKGMLTGPVTILQWSFVRDDEKRSVVAEQIAWAIRDEVRDTLKMRVSVSSRSMSPVCAKVCRFAARSGASIWIGHAAFSGSRLAVYGTIPRFIRICVMPSSATLCLISPVWMPM